MDYDDYDPRSVENEPVWPQESKQEDPPDEWIGWQQDGPSESDEEDDLVVYDPDA
jgi:hypothetical protein